MKKYKNFIRITAAVFQAVIDTLVYHLGFRMAVQFWFAGRTPPSFTPEVQNFFTGAMLAVFYFNSLYSFKTWMFWDEIKAVLKSSFMILLIIVLYLYSQNLLVSRLTILSGIIFFIPLCIASRYIFRRTLSLLKILSTDIIILGAGRTGKIFAEKIITHPFTMGRIAGFLDDDPSKLGTTVSGFKVIGKIEDFTELCSHENFDEAAVAISTASRQMLTKILNRIEFSVRQVHYIPDTYMLTTFSPLVRDFEGMPVISPSQGLLKPFSRAVKSIADYAGALSMLLVLSPVMLWTALRIKLNDGGKILTSYERAGLNGKTFRLFKFRRSGLKPKKSAAMKRSYIDEFPQLFNVLRGEMSLVGPKALILRDMKRVYGGENAQKISMIKPGITGFWQISKKSENDRKIIAETNLYYIRNWSLWLDLVIVVRTILIVLFH